MAGVALAAAACGSSAKDGPADAPVDTEPDAPCPQACTADGRAVVDCNGEQVTACGATATCDDLTATCIEGCTAAEANKSAVGCDYYATNMDLAEFGDKCFAAIVANTWPEAAHITVRFQGQELPVESFTKIPVGAGGSLTYSDYDATAGLASGEVAVVFLGGPSNGSAPCPVPSAVATSSFNGTGIGSAFEIETDVPVVAYQINPYGGGAAAVTGASLLLPTSVWGTEYIAVNAFGEGIRNTNSSIPGSGPSLNVVAGEDGTTITITPVAPIVGGGGIPATEQGQPLSLVLAKGQHAQLTQPAELTGSIVTSNKPVGFMAGQPCMNVPIAVDFCDHGEQMIPPVSSIGSHYVAAMYRPRVANETEATWRVVGVVDGTQLTYSTPVGGPATLSKGQKVAFQTGIPFEVSSQDADHPFLLFEYMTGSATVSVSTGDPDFVLQVPSDQYLDHYVFFADPSYPETDLVVVRKRDTLGQFQDVTLDCAGVIDGWQAIGTDFEFTRVDLSTGNFQAVGNCSTGRHEIHSDAPFGLWVWGWGSATTTPATRNVSYGYPAGMSVQPINNVLL